MILFLCGLDFKHWRKRWSLYASLRFVSEFIVSRRTIGRGAYIRCRKDQIQTYNILLLIIANFFDERIRMMWNEFDGYYSEEDLDGYSEGTWGNPGYYMPGSDNVPHMIQEAQFSPNFNPNFNPNFRQGSSGNRNNMDNMPTSAPPAFVPARGVSTFRVDSGSMRHCLRRFTYVWQSNGMEYWMFPLNVSRTTVTGFRWNNRFGWSFVGVSLNRIDSFMCV